jgi:hypothetical protein
MRGCGEAGAAGASPSVRLKLSSFYTPEWPARLVVATTMQPLLDAALHKAEQAAPAHLGTA